jgi:hypothetical protein
VSSKKMTGGEAVVETLLANEVEVVTGADWLIDT